MRALTTLWELEGIGAPASPITDTEKSPNFLTLAGVRPPGSIWTSFKWCFLPRSFGGWDGYPCRGDEETSCNQVNATCSNVLKTTGTMRASAVIAKVVKAQKDCTSGGLGGFLCNARLIDLPMNIVLDRPWHTVWGSVVYGKAGSWAFDNYGARAHEHIFEVPQPGGPSDYYLCDSIKDPKRCALLGGNMKHACGDAYNPRKCGFCVDKGDWLECEVRGWNIFEKEWRRVPIYPKDVIGNLGPINSKADWVERAARPIWATVTFEKEGLRNVKVLPEHLIDEGGGPAPSKAWTSKLPPANRVKIINELVSGGEPQDKPRIRRAQPREDRDVETFL